ncbi:MAG: M23 family metallopeptidase [Natronosporangium sp.]
MNKLAAAALAPILAVVLLVAAAVAAVSSLTGGSGGGILGVGCHIPSHAATAAPSQPAATVAGLDKEQTGNAAVIISVGQGLGVPPQGWVTAIATALQESALRNLDHGDRDSLGMFQQRPSQGWGTREQIMDPTHAATVFYERLLQVPGWQDMPLTEAAQAVQRSAFPDAYARHEQRATEIVTAVASVNGWTIPGDLEQCVSNGEWTQPVIAPIVSEFRSAERPDHDGVDLGAARGTPISAASDGVVSVAACNVVPASHGCDQDGSPSVQGCGWYVDIQHKDGVVTRYCHMATQPQVQVGEEVAAGQYIGVVGSSGHSSGPHLHFEVRLGSDPVDPVAFMEWNGAGLGLRWR